MKEHHPSVGQLREPKQAIAEVPWLSRRYLTRLIQERRIPSYRIGGKVLVDLADLEKLVADGRREVMP